MDSKAQFSLYKWISKNESQAVAVFGGSATPALSLSEIISLSSDPESTRAAFNFHDKALKLGTSQGDLSLREVVAGLFDTGKSNINAGNIVVTNSATGGNHIAFRSLLKQGDHVICQYPTYGPLIEEPIAIGCQVSYLALNGNHGEPFHLEKLKELIKPGNTKMLVLNNPTNPTGTFLSTEFQREIIKIAKEHQIIIHCDEIFRPLFYGNSTPTSFIEHADLQYDNVYVTSSLSKAYGMSGVRIGWIASRSPDLLASFLHWRQFSVQSTSQIDEAIAAEALGPRCLPGILKKHLSFAKSNLELMETFVHSHKDQVEWVHPAAGAVTLVKFKDFKTGSPVDDVAFCKRLLDRKGVLASPASSCFVFGGEENQLKGKVRVHFTLPPAKFKDILTILGEFLDEERSLAPN